MPSCSAYDCTNKKIPITNKDEDCSRNVSFHCFPKDRKRCYQWAVAVRRQNEEGGLWLPRQRSMLCSDHFTAESFNRTGQTIRLRENAVPTIFSYKKYLKGSSGDVSKTAVVQERLQGEDVSRLPEDSPTHSTQEQHSLSGKLLKNNIFSPSKPTSPLAVLKLKNAVNDLVKLKECSVNLGRRLSPLEISSTITSPGRKRSRTSSPSESPKRKVCRLSPAEASTVTPSGEGCLPSQSVVRKTIVPLCDTKETKNVLVNTDNLENVDDPGSVDRRGAITGDDHCAEKVEGSSGEAASKATQEADGNKRTITVMVKASVNQLRAPAQAEKYVAEQLAEEIAQRLAKCANSKNPATVGVITLPIETVPTTGVNRDQAVGAPLVWNNGRSYILTPHIKEMKKKYNRLLKKYRRRYKLLQRRYSRLQKIHSKTEIAGTPEQIISDAQKYMKEDHLLLLESQLFMRNKSGKGNRFSQSFMKLMAKYYTWSEAGYRYLQTILTLPSIKTVRKWMEKQLTVKEDDESPVEDEEQNNSEPLSDQASEPVSDHISPGRQNYSLYTSKKARRKAAISASENWDTDEGLESSEFGTSDLDTEIYSRKFKVKKNIVRGTTKKTICGAGDQTSAGTEHEDQISAGTKYKEQIIVEAEKKVQITVKTEEKEQVNPGAEHISLTISGIKTEEQITSIEECSNTSEREKIITLVAEENEQFTILPGDEEVKIELWSDCE